MSAASVPPIQPPAAWSSASYACLVKNGRLAATQHRHALWSRPLALLRTANALHPPPPPPSYLPKSAKTPDDDSNDRPGGASASRAESHVSVAPRAAQVTGILRAHGVRTPRHCPSALLYCTRTILILSSTWQACRVRTEPWCTARYYSSTSDGSGCRMVGLPPQAVQMARPIGGRAELLCIGALLLAATVREGDAAAECAGGWECGELPAAVVPTGTFPSPARFPVQK